MHRVLTAALLALVPTVAFANCPPSLDPTSRLNCFGRAINAAETTIASLQAANTALETRLSDLEADVELQDGDIADLFTASASTDAAVSSLQGDVDDLAKSLDTLGVIDVGNLFTYLTVDTSTNSVIFSGANVYVQSGSGATDGPLNGLGNLIVGYDEDAAAWGLDPSDKSGSHNLVVGMVHSYSSYGGFVAGVRNTISGDGASVSGGSTNTASGFYSTVVGGESNTASGSFSTVGGGTGGSATGIFASVAGGGANIASGLASAVLGGDENTAAAYLSTVSGGLGNVANGVASSLLGGNSETTSSTYEIAP